MSFPHPVRLEETCVQLRQLRLRQEEEPYIGGFYGGMGRVFGREQTWPFCHS